MPLGPAQRCRLHCFFSTVNVGHMTLHDAGTRIREIVPDYGRGAVASMVLAADGARWYVDPVEALTHEIWSATQRPHDPYVTVVGALVPPLRDEAGLYIVRPPRRMRMPGRQW